MISGPPAAGKGTQCERIVEKVICFSRLQAPAKSAHKHVIALLTTTCGMQFGLIHISAGDLLRAEVDAGTPEGKLASEYMNKGQLVPNQVVVDMVKNRLAQPDVQDNGWLLDGYPRSADQAAAILEEGIHPDVFLLIQVGQPFVLYSI